MGLKTAVERTVGRTERKERGGEKKVIQAAISLGLTGREKAHEALALLQEKFIHAASVFSVATFSPVDADTYPQLLRTYGRDFPDNIERAWKKHQNKWAELAPKIREQRASTPQSEEASDHR